MSGTPPGAYSAGVVTGLTSLASRRWLIFAVVLPALALRVLVPAGFMPMRDEQGQLTLMLCPGEVPAAVLAAVDPHAQHHHHHADGHSQGGGPSVHTVCPFALSAGPALAASVELQAVLPVRVDFAASPRHDDPRVDTLQRAQRARAPPVPHQV